jgi:hypothetical protein
MKTILLIVGLILLAGCEPRSTTDQSSSTNSLRRDSMGMDTNNPAITNRVLTNPPPTPPTSP